LCVRMSSSSSSSRHSLPGRRYRHSGRSARSSNTCRCVGVGVGVSVGVDVDAGVGVGVGAGLDVCIGQELA